MRGEVMASGDPLIRRLTLRSMPVGNTGNDTDLLGTLEDLVQGSEVWEIVRRYRLYRYRHSDAQRQTVEVEVIFSRDGGWKIVATDADRGIIASGPSHPHLSVAAAAVRWRDLDGEAMPRQRSIDT